MATQLTQKQNEKWVLKLTAEERRQLEAIVRKPTAAAGKVAKARALLMTDASDGQTPATDEAIAQDVKVTSRSIASWRKRACEDGPLESLERRPKSPGPTPPIIDGEVEAQLVRLACSNAPAGRARWSVRLLASKLVELEIVETVSRETVRKALKKTRSSRGSKSTGASRRRTTRPS